MKKIVLVIVCLFVFVVGFSQSVDSTRLNDTIYLLDGTKIACDIAKIGNANIVYYPLSKSNSEYLGDKRLGGFKSKQSKSTLDFVVWA